MLKESINIEEKLSGPSSVKVGRRLAELAMSYGQENKIVEGVPIVQRLDPIADSYSGTEKSAVGAIFYVFSEELKKLNKDELARQFAERAASLDFRQ